MHLNHVGRDITIGFDSEDEAKALFAVLSGTSHTLDARLAEHGGAVYKWFFEKVQLLATEYARETAGYQATPRPPKRKKE